MEENYYVRIHHRQIYGRQKLPPHIARATSFPMINLGGINRLGFNRYATSTKFLPKCLGGSTRRDLPQFCNVGVGRLECE